MNKPIFIHLPMYDLSGEVKDVAFNVHNIVAIQEFSDDCCRIYTTYSGSAFLVDLDYSELMRQLNEVLARELYPVAISGCVTETHVREE